MTRRRPSSSSLFSFLPLLLLLLLSSFSPSSSSSSSSPSSTNSNAPGSFTSKGELPQLEFARLGAYRFATPSLCLRTQKACYVLCARPSAGLNSKSNNNIQALRDEGGGNGEGEGEDEIEMSSSLLLSPTTTPTTMTTGSGLHIVSPGVGCLCQGQDGDVLAQVSLLRKEAERYLHAYGHPIPARVLAFRLGALLGGKGQETWSRPPCCISILMTSSRTRAEMYQIDPTGVVLSVRGAAFGGKGVEDPVAHGLQEWLVEEMLDGREEEEGEGGIGEGGENGIEKGGEEEDARQMWRKLWEGMRKHFPFLAAHPEKVECAMACGASFQRLGRLDKVLKRS